MALVANIVLTGPAGAVEWCEPRTANEAYDAIMKATPDGSDLDVEARELAEDRRADGEFDTEETREDLHDLAVEHDYLFDCAARAYRYVPDESGDDPGDNFDSDDGSDDDAAEDAEDAAEDAEDAAEDEADEDEADEDEDSPPASSPTTAPARTAPPAARPAPARPSTPAPAPSYRSTPQAPVASSSGSGSYAYSYNYSYPNKWAPTATTAPRAAAGPTQITSAPLIKSMPTPAAAVSSGTETTRRVSNGADRRLFLVPLALGIALGVECMKRWAQRRRRF